jgi:8-oxo-dGTP pyrophosphatase MutT (NUDIX family)
MPAGHHFGAAPATATIAAMNIPAKIWKPDVTVAAVIERDGRFLLIEEETERGPLFNQPAGHLESNETLTEAVVRETLEECAHDFLPDALLGIYHHSQPGGTTYMRFAFSGKITRHNPARALDDGIIRHLWMSADEARACSGRHRSPLVMQCIDDFLAGILYPLAAVARYAPQS